jgi:GNAT superfamily N-acetyltransferase
VLEEKPLDPAVHERAAFDCGVLELDTYLQRYADQHRRCGITNVYVLVDDQEPHHILGYYTLSAAEVDVKELREADRRKLPCYPIPCFRMGRLASRTDRRGSGIGKLLVACAVDRCLQARLQVAAYALIVDAKDANAKEFYEHYGFTSFSGRPLTLYLLLGR